MADIQENLQSKSQNVCNQLVISSSMYLTFTTQFCAEYNIEDVMLSSTLNHFVRNTSTDVISPTSSTGSTVWLWETFQLISFSLFVHLYLCTLVGDCGNLYPYTVTDDRVGRNKKRKDNVKEFFRRDCTRNFSYHETLLCHLCSKEILE